LGSRQLVCIAPDTSTRLIYCERPLALDLPADYLTWYVLDVVDQLGARGV
jgi:hypothetical protein